MIFSPDVVRSFPKNSDTGKIARNKVKRKVVFVSTDSVEEENKEAKSNKDAQNDERFFFKLDDQNDSVQNEYVTTDDDEYDTDIEECSPTKEEDEEYGTDDLFVGKRKYVQACQKFAVFPQLSALKQLEKKCLNLSKRSLGPEVIKPICFALTDNLRVENLILDNTDLQNDGAVLVVQMMLDNLVITRLNLASNSLGFESARHLAWLLSKTSTLQHLNLADNKFDDESLIVISKGLTRNRTLQTLNLSKNIFGPDGSKALGAAIAENETLNFLDVNWNYIRGEGSVGICKSFKDNLTLRSLHIAWNGLGYEGTVGVSDALKGNLSLAELDISFNRINWQCAEILAKGLKLNNTLEVLFVGNNPVTTTGAMDIVTAVSHPTSKVRYLNLMNVSVIPETEILAMAIQITRKFKLIHGGVVRTHDTLGERKEKQIKAMERVLNYMKPLGLRPIELLREFDKSVHFHISEKDFINKLKSKGIKLHHFEMKDLARAIATRDDGTPGRGINYRKLVDAVSEHVIQEREEKIKIREKRRKIVNYHRRLLSQKLPLQAIADAPLEEELNQLSSTQPGSQLTNSVTSMSSMLLRQSSSGRFPNLNPKSPVMSLSSRSRSSVPGTTRSTLSLCAPLDKTQVLLKSSRKKRIKNAKR